MSQADRLLIGVINKLSKKIRRYCDRNASEMGLTGTQGRVLCYIFITSQWQDIYQRDIEDVFEIRRSTATGILQLLERDGYIERVSVPTDARLKKIVLTDKAKELQTLVIHETERAEQMLKTGLSEDEVNAYIRLTDRICNNIA
ncbi:MarR family transcriptional regulator [uncultured Victivallis sp.]|uniref:MarR family winged helix-turn-helix transcriptional regulator n=1 Tax=uncultured Victivallis sp. TaxID=354118 RepID=UPI0025CF0EBB|nr:MarR family transcriptional regulator [uncultured Victivallis sp.]